MRYYERTDNGYILCIGTGLGGAEITESRYDAIMTAIQNKPQRTATLDYRLKTDLTWEAYEKEPQPEPDLTADEIVDIIFGGAV